MKWMARSFVGLILTIVADRSDASRIGTGFQHNRGAPETNNNVSDGSSYAVVGFVIDKHKDNSSSSIEKSSRWLEKTEKYADVEGTNNPWNVPTASPRLSMPVQLTTTKMPESTSPPAFNAMMPALFTAIPANAMPTTLPPMAVNVLPPTTSTVSPTTPPPLARPSSSPTAGPTTQAPTHGPTVSPSMAPTPIKQYLFLHVFDIRMQFDTTLDNDPSVLIVWNDRIRTATEEYLREGLPYDTLESIQLYAVDNEGSRRGRRRGINKQDQTFRYGGVGVFRGQPPTVEALQLEQQLELSKTASLQDWFHQRHSMLEVTVLQASFTDDDGPAVVEPPGNEKTRTKSPSSKKITQEELSYLIIAGASGAALVAILLLVMVLCRVCPCCQRRRQRNRSRTTVQKFYPNQTVSLGGEEDDGDDDLINPRRRSCLMMQIVDLDDKPNKRPLVLPRRLLSALPLVDNTKDDNEHSSIDGYSPTNSLAPSTSSPVKHPAPISARRNHDNNRQQPAIAITVPTIMPKGPLKEIIAAKGQKNVPSWMNDSVSSIHASDNSDASLYGKIHDPGDDQRHQMGPISSAQETMDEELYLSLQGRETSLLDSVLTSPTSRQVTPRRAKKSDDASLPFDEDDDVVTASSQDDFDADLTRIERKFETLPRRTTDGLDEKTEYCPQYLCR